MPSPVKASFYLGIKILSGYQELEEKVNEANKFEEKRSYGVYPKRAVIYKRGDRKTKDIFNSNGVLEEIENFFNNESKANPDYEIESYKGINTSTDSIYNESMKGFTPVKHSFTDESKLSLAWSVSNIVFSFVHVKTSLQDVPKDIQTYIWKCVELYLPGSNFHSLSLLILSLGKLGLSWAQSVDVSMRHVKSSIVSELNHILNNLKPQSSLQSWSNMLYGLSLMNISWSNMSPNLRQNIMTKISIEIPSITKLDQLYSLLYAMAELGVSGGTIEISLQQDIFDKFLISVPNSINSYIGNSYNLFVIKYENNKNE
jgi:hypothetical protein